MPLHLLGKKSWNVYNTDNIARVKADEAAAALRESAHEQRIQELDAQRRAAILRGQIPPLLPEEEPAQQDRGRDDCARVGKRRKFASKDDTDQDIRLARSAIATEEDRNTNSKILKLRTTRSNSMITNSAGNIELFSVGAEDANKRNRNMEKVKSDNQRECATQAQHAMRFSDAAGLRNGLRQPWYAAPQRSSSAVGVGTDSTARQCYSDGNERDKNDRQSTKREMALKASYDPFNAMQKAQVQLNKSRVDRKRWADERAYESKELRAIAESKKKRRRHVENM